ncbi:MAG: arginase, partial [Acidobacteriota bacterium]
MKQSHIAIIGAPLDLGQGRRGVEMGPSALRVAGLGMRLASLGYRVSDLGNIAVAQAESLPDAGPREARYVNKIAESCERLGQLVSQSLAAARVPLVLGGDHSIAAGTVAGVSHFFRQSGQTAGLLWIDAHADMNTPESSPSGNVHGMPLACCIGHGPEALVNLLGFFPKVNPAHVALVGLRDVDDVERGAVRGTGVRAFTMRDIDER